MCGIVGFNYNDKEKVQRLNDLLVHRGPDQSGFFCDEEVSLAQRRLSILDLSDKGRQPMTNEDGSLVLVYNGEIFNYRELREELLNKGHVFRSHTDTEVLVHLYEEMGRVAVERLNGQFAFCVYDRKRQELFLARDRMGILPLFCYAAAGEFMFASELKAILRSGVKKEIDSGALAVYFRFGYIPAPFCILRNAFKVKPAHYLVYDLKSKEIKEQKRYWRFRFSADLADKDASAVFLRDELERSVSMRLVADVPVGAFLSGGVDSSAVVALITKSKQHLKTFSIKFDHASFDESSYARKVAELFKTEHHEINFSAKDVRRLLPSLAVHYDEPFGDSSAIPTYFVSQVAREHVTVCLSGDGGDELLAGYDSYRHFAVLRRLNDLPAFIKSSLRFLLGWVLSFYPRFEVERVRELLSLKKIPDKALFERLCEKIDRGDLERLLMRKVDFSSLSGTEGEESGLEALQDFDISNYLQGDILAKVDRAAMANSLETRPPFLDHNFVELCLRMHRSLKIKGGSGKWILKYAFAGILPSEVLTRKKKGFGVPLKYYFRNELADLVQKYVFDYSGHDLFDRYFLKSMSAPGKVRDTRRIYWNVIMFNLWHEVWMLNNE